MFDGIKVKKMTKYTSTKKLSVQGRAARANLANRFHAYNYEYDPELEDIPFEYDSKTEITEVHPKTIVNKVESPDVPMEYSLNPYQGCEHGCIYCYARNTHAYWGYNAGLDFEQKIMVKRNAPSLLEKTIKKASWKAAPIVMSGNTDCYQPIERKEELTRECLKIFLKYKHPVGIITKNALVLRDLDLLKKLNELNLVHVVLSITTLNERLRRKLEPRTATVLQRLRTLDKLNKEGIPTMVMMAPIIPGLNDHEVLQMAKATSNLGARKLAYTLIRLNGDVEPLFMDWIATYFPNKKDRVEHLIKESRKGKLGDSKFGRRMKGEGTYAEHISGLFKLARKKFFDGMELPKLDCSLHAGSKDPQLKLF
jgi:DNA repair photolyase